MLLQRFVDSDDGPWLGCSGAVVVDSGDDPCSGCSGTVLLLWHVENEEEEVMFLQTACYCAV